MSMIGRMIQNQNVYISEKSKYHVKNSEKVSVSTIENVAATAHWSV